MSLFSSLGLINDVLRDTSLLLQVDSNLDVIALKYSALNFKLRMRDHWTVNAKMFGDFPNVQVFGSALDAFTSDEVVHIEA
jgi:hypothetical protein